MYQSAIYIETASNVTAINVLINGTSSVVPLDTQNTDFVAITALVAAGQLTIAPKTGS